MAKSLPLCISYLVFTGIIIQKKQVIGCNWLKLFEVGWLRTLLIASPDISISTWKWGSRSKWWRIGALTNACLNLVNAKLALRVKTSNSTIFLDLNIFWPFFSTSLSPISLPSTLPQWISLPPNLQLSFCPTLPSQSSLTPPFLSHIVDSILLEVFIIKVNDIAIQLNL